MNGTRDFESRVVTASPDTSCVDLAELMDLETVGSVVIVEGDVPVGILTDRDLVCRVIAAGRNPEKTKAREVMTPDPTTTERGVSLEELLELMREKQIRRIPVTENGRLAGLFSLDDLIEQLSSYLLNLDLSVRQGLQESQRFTKARRQQEAREEALEEIRRQLYEFGDHARETVIRELRRLLGRDD